MHRPGVHAALLNQGHTMLMELFLTHARLKLLLESLNLEVLKTL